MPYAEALARQDAQVAARREGRAQDTLFLLEHPATVTLGRRSLESNLLVPEKTLIERGIAVHRVARGGDVTFHAPGQLVGYPILDLKARGQADVVAFLRRLEALLIEALESFEIAGYTREGMTGVFATPGASGPPRKIASIGIGVRRWVTFHGFALNVSLDPSAFDVIVPCGLHDVRMTSIVNEVPAHAGPELMSRARGAVEAAFRSAYD